MPRHSRPFAHLHVHSDRSILDGAAKIEQLVERAAADGQPALAVTDHGNMSGALDLYKACGGPGVEGVVGQEKAEVARALGVKPIIGCEVYMARESRHERPAPRTKAKGDEAADADESGTRTESEKDVFHLIALAETSEGYHNLVRLSSQAWLGGFYRKPRVDWELLERYHEGLIVTTGCLGGLVLQALLRGDEAEATRTAARLQDIFGRESLFVEVQDHGLPEQRRTNPLLVELARRIGAPLVATNDSHYCRREDAEAHDALLCVQTGAKLDQEDRFHFDGEEHYLKTAAEMRELFSELPEACDNTLLIAERVCAEVEFGGAKLPEFPRPPLFQAVGADGYLRHLVDEGAARRYGAPVPAEVRDRLDYELRVISEMGYSDYFLIVADLVRWARASGIGVGPGRGSAAGSCASYCLGITDVDPIRYGLLFERFLNPGRRQMPDIDLDFARDGRQRVIDYVAERYGSEHVARIGTFGTIKSRAAVRDAARVLGHPFLVGDKVAKALPPVVMGRDTPLAACLERVAGHEAGYEAAEGLRELVATDEAVAEVVEVARGIEGLTRSTGIHASAVIISADPLVESVPLARGKGGAEGPIVTQYDMHGVEELGHLKLDFLGLDTLDVIDRATALVESRTGEPLEMALDDRATFDLLREGDTTGIFQVEGYGMRELLRRLGPTSIDDLSAVLALYRPGPMAAGMHHDYAEARNGRSTPEVLHPEFGELLADTYGLMIYQESLMRVAQRFAGYDLATADDLRKSCSKKLPEDMARHRNEFVAGCVERGYGERLGVELFSVIEHFADYAFNKSHSTSYAVITYKTACLKANHPAEFLAASLAVAAHDKGKVSRLLADARRHGTPVLVPDVNESAADTTVVDGRVRLGLAGIKGVGPSAVEPILDERRRGGSFASYGDLVRRLAPQGGRALHKGAIELLLRAGALDSLLRGIDRAALLATVTQDWRPRSAPEAPVFEDVIDRELDRLVRLAKIEAKVAEKGGEDALREVDRLTRSQLSFPVDTMYPDVESWTEAERLEAEHELLGDYISGHPLDRWADELDERTDCDPGDLAEVASAGGERTYRVGGVITNLNVKRQRSSGQPWATFALEGLGGTVEEVVVRCRQYSKVKEHVTEGLAVVVEGRVEVDLLDTVEPDDENSLRDPFAGAKAKLLVEAADRGRSPGVPLGEARPVVKRTLPPARQRGPRRQPEPRPARRKRGSGVPVPEPANVVPPVAPPEAPAEAPPAPEPAETPRPVRRRSRAERDELRRGPDDNDRVPSVLVPPPGLTPDELLAWRRARREALVREAEVEEAAEREAIRVARERTARERDERAAATGNDQEAQRSSGARLRALRARNRARHHVVVREVTGGDTGERGKRTANVAQAQDESVS